jgi:hypothetical protein
MNSSLFTKTIREKRLLTSGENSAKKGVQTYDERNA